MRVKKTVWGDYVIEKDIEVGGEAKIEEITEISELELYELMEDINELIEKYPKLEEKK